MKKIMMTLVAALSLSIACMADEKSMNTQETSLMRYLDLDETQMDALVTSGEKFRMAVEEQIETATANQLWLLTNDHLVEVRQILDNEQFKLYLQTLDRTLVNKGLHAFTGYVWE